jgi:hypothetical protein
MELPMPDSDSNVTDTHPDFLSPLAAAILQRTRATAYRELVVHGPTPSEASNRLVNVRAAELLNVTVKDAEEAQAVLGGLWLWLDGLNEAHQLVQDLIGPTGAFWHAIMHRREGDFSNAKYWYDRCEGHRAMRLLGAVASDIVGPEAARDPMVQHIVAAEWNPRALVDLVAAVHDKPDDSRFQAAVQLQQIEWRTLFRHCVMKAAGAPE